MYAHRLTRMKHLIRCGLLLFVLFFSSHTLLANEDNMHHVRVGFFSQEGYQETDGIGNHSGYGYDLLMLMQRYGNLKFEFVGMDNTWVECLQMLRDGEIDMLTPVRMSKTRSLYLDYSLPIGEDAIKLTARADEKRLKPYTTQTFNGITVGMIEGFEIINEVFARFANDYGFSYSIRYYPSTAALHEALHTKMVDAIVSTTLRKGSDDEMLLYKFNTQNIYAAVRKGNTELLDEINYAIAQMDRNESDWRNRLFYKNIAQKSAKTLEFTEREMAYIHEHSTAEHPIVLAMDNNWRPFSQKNATGYSGIIPDYWDEIMKLTGMKYTYYDNNAEIFVEHELVDGKADVYLGYCFDEQVADAAGYICSPPFMTVSTAMVFRKDRGNIKKIGFCRNCPRLNSKLKMEAGQTAQYFNDSDEAIEAVKSGLIDAVYVYTVDAKRLQMKYEDNLLNYILVPGQNLELRAISSSYNDHTLISIISKCINHMQGTATDNIVTRNVSSLSANLSLGDLIRLHPIAAIITLIIILLLIGAAIYLFVRARMRRVADMEALKAAQMANEAKTSFLFNMSHDIRTPMNAIMGFRDLLEKHQDDPERRANYLQNIKDASSVLLSIINNVLEMARIEKGTLKVEEAAWDAQAFNDTLFDVFPELMASKNITFTREIKVQHPHVYCDPMKTREIFLNILSNAYKYTGRGGHVHMRVVEVASDREGWANYQTTISDTGIGMSPEFLPHIFEEFAREYNTTERKVEGTGLGMPIVKRLVEILGGSIEVYSEKGVGTTFIVTLPHRIVEGSSEQQLVETKTSLDEISFDGKRILMAEDNDLNAEISTEILQSLGFEIERVANGQECVEMMTQARPNHYDIILMDIQMPVMNGYEATQAIRKLEDPRRAGIPIVALTANAFEEDKRNALEAGMNAHLAKPLDISVLITTLQQVLKRQKVQ